MKRQGLAEEVHSEKAREKRHGKEHDGHQRQRFMISLVRLDVTDR